MKVTSTLNIGGASFTFEVEDAEEMAAMVNSITLASPRRTCNVCGADGLETKQLLAYRTKEGYRYVKVQCECGARSSLGQYRDGDGFFWKEYEEYTPDGATLDGSGATGRQVVAPPEPQQPQGERITPAALDAINQKLKILEWSPKEVTSWLENSYGVGRLQDLDLETSRQVYRDIEAVVKREVPF